MPPKPRAHAFGEGIDVAVDAQHPLSRVFAGGNRIAGVRRIYENEIEVLEPRIRIVGHSVWRRGHRAVVANDNALRSESAEMQPDRRRTWTAVEHEAHGSTRRRTIREKVRRGEHRRLGFAVTGEKGFYLVLEWTPPAM